MRGEMPDAASFSQSLRTIQYQLKASRDARASDSARHRVAARQVVQDERSQGFLLTRIISES